MGETFDSAGVALCCAAAIRLGGAVRVLAAGVGLDRRYDVVAAGVEQVAALLSGPEREVDPGLLGPAFGMNWTLDGGYSPELPGAEFFRKAGTVVFVTLVAARPGQQIAPAQGLTAALEAAAVWPSEAERLAEFESAGQREAEALVRQESLGGFAVPFQGHRPSIVCRQATM